MHRTNRLAYFLGCLFALAFASLSQGRAARSSLAGNTSVPFFIGTYTSSKSKGIYRCRLDLQSGAISPPVLVAETVNPSFLALAPDHRHLYAVNELSRYQGRSSGAVSAFAIDPVSGKLTLLNQEPSGGADPCHLAVDATGRDVLVANYTGGSVAVLPIEKDGKLGPASAFVQHHGSSINPKRQAGPHAHCVALTPDNRFVFVCDLGLDRIMIYRFDPQAGSIRPSDPPWVALTPGSGPRHLTFSPSHKYAYLISELGSIVTLLDFDPVGGTLSPVQTVSTLPADFSGANISAEIEVHPSGKFLYGSNRGHDSIAVFRINKSNGHLTPIQRESSGGKAPRSFAVGPSGHFLVVANQDSNNLVSFRIDPESGKLEPTGQAESLSKPVCVLFQPSAGVSNQP